MGYQDLKVCQNFSLKEKFELADESEAWSAGYAQIIFDVFVTAFNVAEKHWISQLKCNNILF